ncbi:uncharacterized protein LOC102804018 [Saccoglossus kowalevskii]|uniref:Uncharacterized protein LOC102804018 n=1 Tax=Saccoglossus kowalevskii TaxID=10224 RepID=A0ABM0MKT3_SACKO|nr:PREDICTED: uncharacterized protein LOC102804018 [Saccoglossus kowalevskii]
MSAPLNLPSPRNNTDSIRSFYDSLKKHIRGLKSLEKSEENYGDLLVPIVFEKLPTNLKTQISRDHGNKAWTIQELRESIQREIHANQAANTFEQFNTCEDTPLSSASNFHINAKPRRRPACVFCKENHTPNKCTTVTDPQQRKDIVFRNKLCLNCFGPNHRSNECWSKFSCRICSKKHHTSICGSPTTSHPKASERVVKSTKEDVTHVKLTPTSGPVLLKATTATVSTSNASTTANILLDEGAQRTFITEDLARKLQINSEDCSIEHITLGAFGRDKSYVRAIKRTEITLKTNSGNIALQCLIVPKISSPIQNVVAPTLQRHKYLQKLKIAPLVESGCFDIDLLLGADHYWQIVEDHVVRGAGPTAVSSKFGYLLSGPSHLNNVTTMNTTIMKALADTDHEQFIISQYWDLETMGITANEDSKLKSTTFEEYQDTKIQRDGNKYTAGLPWKENCDILPTNYVLAKNRTRAMVKRLKPELRKVYNSVITEQLRRGFIEKVIDEDISRGHFIPHHPVEKQSSTTPVRVVYNCSAKYRDQPSLNDCLESGPAITNDIASFPDTSNWTD